MLPVVPTATSDHNRYSNRYQHGDGNGDQYNHWYPDHHGYIRHATNTATSTATSTQRHCHADGDNRSLSIPAPVSDPFSSPYPMDELPASPLPVT